jgi:UDP:flavonoid glycosyltransferase YjiC (YdhE family)
MKRMRVLFVAEDITLAQVVRLATLARALDPEQYDVHFACARFDEMIFGGMAATRHPIFTVDAKRAFRRLERGQRLYGTRVLARYVEEELALFRRIEPDVVVGDLRFSLSVSAPHAAIPYVALINAYWSRAMVRSEFPLPEHPIVRLLGQRLASEHFTRALPWVFAHFAAPVNRLRKRYGLAPLGDLIDLLMFGDRTVFPDIPLLTPLRKQAPSELFLGAVSWSPPVAPPSWWHTALRPGPASYVTLGSSGRVDRLPKTLAGLARLRIPLMLATAGRVSVDALGAELLAAPFLPGAEAARRSSFVVCNGGSSTAYQALAEGRPVLGIASNLDQYLAMTAVRDVGAGILLRGDSLTEDAVETAARALLEDERYTRAARRVASELATYDSAERFRGALHSLVGRS